ncbi:methyltransferase [Trinickia sp. LjRoot230]|uniref:CheR family methyltransferase n=1 Tax=Trinickia sp. LjRoot230 TaxID=3342288 RepID=UPI003ECDD54C
MNATDQRFENWLSRETGIDASSLGINALERAVFARMRVTQSDARLHASHLSLGATVTDDPAVSIDDDVIDAYWQMLNSSPDERQALVEALVVPETWFFRDREAFVALARLANERLVREPARVLRVLSAPCSTGEEPYSIAMALLDAGIGAARFTIDARDISARAIELAHRAVYSRNSFRGHALEFRERHFRATDDGWLLNERVQQAVHFAQANLLEPPHGADARYDFIFCRNLLIYLHREAQDCMIRLLDAQLADDGTIFFGPAETGLMMRHAMTSAHIPLAFAFQRARPGDTAFQVVAPFGKVTSTHDGQWAQKLQSAAWPHPAAAPVARLPFFASSSKPARQPLAAPPVQAHEEPPLSLGEARRVADTGQLDEAQRLAHEFVIRRGPNADAFHLLGLIADAHGRNADASDFYRKALYLEPNHYEALTHLAALLDMTGESAAAQQLMRRAQRAAMRMPISPAEQATHSRGFHGSRRP